VIRDSSDKSRPLNFTWRIWHRLPCETVHRASPPSILRRAKRVSDAVNGANEFVIGTGRRMGVFKVTSTCCR
jgi:hypothetical protein